MGTTYHIKVVARAAEMAPLQTLVDERLRQINQSMSTHIADSEISRFNAQTEVGTPFAISADFLRVMLSAQEIYSLTQGAWDVTVEPLVTLWGFGTARPRQTLPAPSEIDSARARVGLDQIDVDVNGYLIKKRPDVMLDLASIAKGYAVDQIAIMLRTLKYRDLLVEIGGEIYAAGRRPDGTPWRVGINQPDPDAPVDAVYKVARLSDLAMATSGDYRNFFEVNGEIYAHIIDPRTGYPVKNGVVSASVIADSCGFADGLATALVVMGPAQGIALLDRLQGVEGLIVVRGRDGGLEEFWSANAHALLH
jgi:FAD:protein FMN transferase